MTENEVIAKTKSFLEEKFREDSSGHDYWHIYRVFTFSKHIAESETGVNAFVLELAALLHDVADWKFNDGDIDAGPRAARQWLKSLKVDELVIQQVEQVIRDVTFKGARVITELKSIEGKIVSDADKLDAMGAIGIGRAFAYGGSAGYPMHEPGKKAEQHSTFEAYKKSKSSTINHFDEKLLLLKDRMHTSTGKKIALARHKIMENFLEEFHAEWEGKK